MRFHTFGDESRPVIVLVHGVLTPWQIWSAQIERFKEAYHVVVAALDAHEEEAESEFVSIQEEARQIEDYCVTHFGGEIFALCGLSMGGAISYVICKNRRLRIHRLVMDGAPLSPVPKIATMIMISNYIAIINKSKKRDNKVIESFKKNFLPEKYLGSYLKIADNMTEQSVRNIVSSAMSETITDSLPTDTKLLFIHGTKGNEVVSGKAAKKLKKLRPDAQVHCFSGYAHCEAAIYKPDEWLDIVQNFLGE